MVEVSPIKEVNIVNKLLIIPIVFAGGYLLYRYMRNAISGKGECHGDCARCSQELMEKVHGKSQNAEH